MTDDERWMAAAVALARRGLGTTAPNPSVGAVLVRDGAVLGAGFTAPVGGPHAEVRAIAAAREAGHDPRGATLYVTLEPCRHHGRTPPCTDALFAAGVNRVVVGVVDPFPPMRGRSLEELRARRVDVTLGVLGDACADVVRGFSRAIVSGLPEVTLKAASSIDGSLATASGESRWITGEAARRRGHDLRASHDAIVVGVETLLADDPALTTRDVDGTDCVPVIFDSRLRTPASSRALHGVRRAVVVTADDAPDVVLPADVVRVARGAGGVDVEAALRALASLGLHRVLVEGGGRLLRSFLDSGLADTLHLFLGAVIVPGGRRWVGGNAVPRLSDALHAELVDVERLGDGVATTWRLPHRLGGG